MTIGSGRASILTVLTIAFATVATTVFAGQGKGTPILGVPIPIPGPSSSGDAFCTPRPGSVQLLGFSCLNPDYVGPPVPQDLTFVIPPAPGKLPKKLRYPPDAAPASCDSSGCGCDCD